MRIYKIMSAILISGLLLSACTATLLKQKPAPAATALASLHGNQPSEAQLLAAGEAGDVEAQRQLANGYQPRKSFGVPYGNAAEAIRWFRRACAAGYANAEVDFYEFAESQEQIGTDGAIEEAVACLDDAIRQGHRKAIIDGAFRAAFMEQDYKKGYYLYALLADTEPQYADQRQSFASQLTPAEIAAAEKAASDWRAHNPIRDYDDFFALVNSPFRQSPTPTTAP